MNNLIKIVSIIGNSIILVAEILAIMLNANVL